MTAAAVANRLVSLLPSHMRPNRKVVPAATGDVERPLLTHRSSITNTLNPSANPVDASTSAPPTLDGNDPAATAAAMHQHLPEWAAFTNDAVQFRGGCVCLALIKLNGPVSTCCYSADGRLIAVAGDKDDPRVLVFSSSSSKLLWELTGHTKAVMRVLFCQKDSLLVSGSLDGSCIVWDMQNGKQLSRLAHEEAVHNIDISPDGRLLACMVPEVGQCVVWSLEGQDTYHQVMTCNTYSMNATCVCFSPDSSRLATAVHPGRAGTSSLSGSTAKVWDVTTGAVVAELPGDEERDKLWDIKLFDRNKVLCAHATHIQVWDIKDCSRPVKHQQAVAVGYAGRRHIAVSHSGLLFACSLPLVYDQVAVYALLPERWQDHTQDVPPLFTVTHPKGAVDTIVTQCRWSPDDSMLLTMDRDEGRCFIWSTESGAMLWDLSRSKSELSACMPEDEECTIRDCTFAPDGQTVVLGLSTGTLLMVQLKPKSPSLLAWLTDGVVGDLSEDGLLAATAHSHDDNGSSATIHINSIATGELLYTSPPFAAPVVSKHYSKLYRLAMSPDGQYVATIVGRSHDVAVWSVKHGMVLERTLTRPLIKSDGELLESAYRLAFSPDGKTLALLAREGPYYGNVRRMFSLHIWEVATGSICASVPDVAASSSEKIFTGVLSVRYSADQTQVGCVLLKCDEGATSCNGLVRFDTRTMEQLPMRLPGPLDCESGLQVWDVAYSKQGARLAVLFTDAAADGNHQPHTVNKVAMLCHVNKDEVLWSRLSLARKTPFYRSSVRWCSDDAALMLAVEAGLLLINAHDGAVTRMIQSPLSAAFCMSADGRFLTSLNTADWAEMMANTAGGSYSDVEPGKGKLLVATASVYACTEVAPDCSSLRFRRATACNKTKPSFDHLAAKFPAMLHSCDWDGVPLLTRALLCKDMKLVVACLQAAADHSHLAQWQMCNALEPVRAIKQCAASGSSNFMQVLLQALVEGKLTGCKGNHTSVALPILSWGLQHDPAVCLQYLASCAASQTINYSTTAGSRQSFLAGLVHHPCPLPAAAVWAQHGGAVALPAQRDVYKGTAVIEHSMEAVVVPFQDAAQPSRHGILSALVQADVPSGFYQVDAVRAVLEVKWEVYGKQLVVQELVLHLLLMAAFSAFCLLLPTSLLLRVATKGRVEWHQPQLQAVCALLLLAAALMTRAATCEARQWFNTGLCQAVSPWNIADLASIVLFFSVLSIFCHGLAHPTWISNASLQALLVLSALENMLLWSRVLHYMCAFKSTGPMVRMVIAIMQDMRYFLVLLACLACGFGVAFYLLFAKAAQHSSDIQDAFATIPRTMLTMLSMMVGGFDQSLFWKADAPWLAVLLFAAYVLVMLVVLFNLLIAIMGDSFEKVKDTEDNEFLKGRAEVLLEVETMQSSRRLARLSQAVAGHVHFLRPAAQAGGSGSSGGREGGGVLEWQGKLKEAERRNRAMLDGLRMELLADLNSIGSELEKRTASHIEELRRDMQQQLEQLQHMLKAALPAGQS